DAAQLPDAASPYGEVHAVVRTVVPLLDDDAALRASLRLPHAQRANAFKSLRADYAVRREFGRLRLSRSAFSTEAAHMLEGLGFLLS
ncbi:MAG: DUF3410 domain-containing protein, partial [Bacteroidota bacterium]|nr:DUF3410 domain-containing protein [Bacteroidota bacterium]